jgi:tRNA-dihydrouridine synthase B
VIAGGEKGFSEMDSHPFLSLAPLQGFTTKEYRRAFFARFLGFSRAYAPFVKAVSAKVAARHYRDILTEAKAPYDLVPQVICNDPAELAETGRQVADLGYREINVNMGCPFPMVANKKRGSGILPYPDIIDRMLDGALPRCPIPISVKLRLGRASHAEAPAVFAVLNRYPLAEIILHPRTGIQMYQGRADLDRFAECLALSRHPLTYNGDILAVEDFLALQDRFPSVARWMIGRGALRDPFLAAKILGTAPPMAERLCVLDAYRRDYEAAYEARFGRTRQLLDIYKGFWSYLVFSFPDAQARALELRRLKDLDAYRAWSDGLFSA